MNKEMYDLAAWSVETAKAAGADNCRVGIHKQRSVEIGYRQREPENIKEASARGLYIDVFAAGRYSRQSTSDLRKDTLQEFISNAVRTTKLLAEDRSRTLPEPKYYADRSNLDLQILDPAYDQFTPQDRHNMVKAIEESCLGEGGDKAISVTAGEGDVHGESVTLTSNGFQGYREATMYWAGAEMTARDAGDRRPEGDYYVRVVARNAMPRPEEIGAITARRTIDLLGAKKIKTETLPIIVENRLAPGLLGGLLQAMSGKSIQQRQSFLADKKGQMIASPRLTVIDDPLLIGGLGSRLYDGDGLPAKKRVIIDSGRLNDFYVDWYYSRKLGSEPTTGEPSNLIIPPGKRSVAEIMKDLGRGILITEFLGGNSNATTGDASRGIFGKLFEYGEPVQSVAEMNIGYNHLTFWHKLAEVANDPWIYSPHRTPSLVFTDVVVSGV